MNTAAQPMSRERRNGQIAVQTEDVTTCIKVLSRRGVAIKKIEIGVLPTPRILVDRNPGLESGAIRLEPGIKTHAATLHKCQIEWRETA